jgi:5-amino-6-(5-phosphoribosylamino)uracil reductase/diaminohydroxyphosphoribosylaminopyrimidine deaminase/5-amino-6-(5-phosphoribosylamino)uracil reductase
MRGDWHCQPSTDLSWQNADEVLLVDDDPKMRAQVMHARGSVSLYVVDERGLPGVVSPAGIVLDPVLATAARVYLPVILGAARAKREGRSFVAGHLTQTLDGRIACENGQSQWIGNEADLHHSHRMRALLEGVIVGATTALHDNPQLTVRHVSGADPRRVVLSGRGRALAGADKLQMMQAPGCEVFAGESSACTVAEPSVVVHSVETEDGSIDPRVVLSKLRERNLHSLYLEGGSGTLSSFLQAGCIDLLQVHIASIVLGSGLPGLQLPAVDHVDQGRKLHMDHAMLDGHVLLTCVPHA